MKQKQKTWPLFKKLTFIGEKTPEEVRKYPVIFHFPFRSFFFSSLLLNSLKENTKRYFIFFDCSSSFIIFWKKINIMKNKSYSDKIDVITFRFPLQTYPYLFAFKRISCSTGYM